MGAYNSIQNKNNNGVEFFSKNEDLNTLLGNNGSHCHVIKKQHLNSIAYIYDVIHSQKSSHHVL
jgi:hypothetical protein